MINFKLLQKFYVLIVLVAFVCLPSVNAEEDLVVDNTIVPFFTALKEGDVVSIKTYVGDPLLSEIRILLDKNQEYPAFLQQYYKDSRIEVTNVEAISQSHKIVSLDLYLSATDLQKMELHVNETSSDVWKITQQAVSQ